MKSKFRAFKCVSADFSLLESSKLISRNILVIEELWNFHTLGWYVKGQSWKNHVWHPSKWRRWSLAFFWAFGDSDAIANWRNIFFRRGPKFRFCTCKKEAAEAFYGLKNNFTMLWKFCTRNILLQDLKTAVTARLQIDLDFFFFVKTNFEWKIVSFF